MLQRSAYSKPFKANVIRTWLQRYRALPLENLVGMTLT